MAGSSAKSSSLKSLLKMDRVHGWSCSLHLSYHYLSLVLLTTVSSCLKVKISLQFNTTVALI